MNNKKPIVLTAVVTIIVTTAFYLTPIGNSIINVMKGFSKNQDFHEKVDIISDIMESSFIILPPKGNVLNVW